MIPACLLGALLSYIMAALSYRQMDRNRLGRMRHEADAKRENAMAVYRYRMLHDSEKNFTAVVHFTTDIHAQ